jgi:hypothetical protein
VPQRFPRAAAFERKVRERDARFLNLANVNPKSAYRCSQSRVA